MRPNLPFLSAASNANLKPGGLLKWKKWLVKDARLSLPLIEVMKIASLTSLLPDMSHLSLQKPRPRPGRRLALLSLPSLTQNLCILYFVLSLALFPHLPLPYCCSSRESTSVFYVYLRTHNSVSQPKALRSRARGYLSEVRQVTYLWCPTRPSASLYPLLNFLVLPQTFPRPLPLAQAKLPIPC